MTTKIEWCDETVNPIRARNAETGKVGWHCEHVDEGCRNCYAERQNKAGARGGTKFDYKPSHVDQGRVEVFLDEKVLARVLRWKEPRSIFWCSMTDLFGRFVTDELRDRCFATMALTPQHQHIVLTKRAWLAGAYFNGPTCERITARIVAMIRADKKLRSVCPVEPFPDGEQIPWPLPNVYVGTSVSDQASADARLPGLLRIAAMGWKVWVSYEPALGAVDFTRVDITEWYQERMIAHWESRQEDALDLNAPVGEQCTMNVLTGEAWGYPPGYIDGLPRIAGLVCGGESGPGARPMHPDWARAARDACAAAGVPFHFKQWGEWAPAKQAPSGTTWLVGTGNMQAGGGPHALMLRPGKKAAGRLLDGQQHDALAWSK